MRARSIPVRTRLACAVAGVAAAGMVLAGCGSAAGQAGPSSSPTAGSSVTASAGSTTQAPDSTAGSVTASTPSTQPVPASSPAGITVVAPPSGPVGTTGPASAAAPRSRTASSHLTSPATTAPRQASTPPSPTPTTHPRTTPAAPTTHPAPSTRHAAGTGALAGKVVVIDPGHNGQNAAHPEIIRQQVPAGFGQYKDCNTTGTQTNAGYPEYRFNWKVALSLRDALQAKGITVVMTRSSDDGVGPCVNKRAAIGNDAHADAVISIHGDGEAAGVRGFYVMTASRAPAGAAMAAQSTALAKDVRGGLSEAGFPVSNTLGTNGLWQRSDLAGLNLSVRPTVMIECGNMRNATEAALMSSNSGQQRYAAGIAAGVLAYLGG